MIVVDTSILSSLAKIKYLHLIRGIFDQEEIVVCNAVMKELLVCREKGYQFVDRILEHTAFKPDELDDTKWLLFRYPDERVSEKIHLIYEKYPHIHFGEVEEIAFANIHDSALLIDDRRACSVAREENIDTYTLPAMIHYARLMNVININDVHQIIHLLEMKDRYRFRNDVKQKLLE